MSHRTPLATPATSALSPAVSSDSLYTISPVDTPSVARTITPDPLSINTNSPALGNSQIRDEVPLLYVSTSIKEASISEANKIARISKVQSCTNTLVGSDSPAPFLISAVAPPDPLLNPSPVPSDSNSEIIQNPYNVPVWLQQLYPELYQTWEELW